jgi:hypothetical protein
MSQSIDYDGSAVETKVGVQFDGWFGADLTHHPLFLTETGTVSRPDLVVDSVVFIPGSPQAAMPVEIRAYVSNRGNRTTPGQVTVGFYCDDSLFFSCLTDTIEQNSADTVVVLYSSAPSWMHGTHLYTALANPGQEYVEKVSTDDNAGFKRLQVVKFPTGQVDVVVPGGVSNVPVVLFQLSTASWEKDTTGQTPADSARIVQYYYGLKDTLVQDSASSGWFSGAVSDTFWQFLFGDGRYRFAVQAKDGAENTSPVYPDSDHQYVVFDTTAAVGSMTINNDARFLNVNQCSVQVTACDSGTGIAAMRLGCRWPANLTADGFRFAAAVHFRPAGA